MESALTYKLIAKVYDLLDILYFNRKKYSPREEVLGYIPKEKADVLDICTGTASNAICIAQEIKLSNVTGIDISQEMLNIAERKIFKKNISNIKLYKMNAAKMEFGDNKFDSILISLVLHEISSDLAYVILSEAKRVLKPNGKLLIIEWEEPKEWYREILFWIIRKMEPKGFESFLKMDMPAYFEKAGFSIDEIKHCDYTKVIVLSKMQEN